LVKRGVLSTKISIESSDFISCDKSATTRNSTAQFTYFYLITCTCFSLLFNLPRFRFLTNFRPSYCAFILCVGDLRSLLVQTGRLPARPLSVSYEKERFELPTVAYHPVETTRYTMSEAVSFIVFPNSRNTHFFGPLFALFTFISDT
jgi:hypothetical protein